MMDIKPPSKQEIIQEALEILSKHMEPSKMVLLVSILQPDGGDYLATREQLFAGETVETLVEKIKAYQESKR
jgi:hypothetical protein